MTTPTSRLSYSDCFDLLQRALDDDLGIRVQCADYSVAWRLRLRIHSARTLERRENAQTYASDHPLYGRSDFDVLYVQIVRNDDETCWLYIKKHAMDGMVVESLSEVDDEEALPLLTDQGAVLIEASVPSPVNIPNRRR